MCKKEPAFYCGLDIGASATKVVVLDSQARLLGQGVERTGIDLEQSANTCLCNVLSTCSARQEDLAGITATGFGRHSISFAHNTKTEISCHARGCSHFFPQDVLLIDIGGQDTKVIRLNAAGKIQDFKMNRKCAAGTGAFLEEIAKRLGIEFSQMNSLASSATEAASLGSYCTVFTKTEILARMREGTSLPVLLRGVMESVVKRVLEMSLPTGDVVMSGGVVAHNPLVAELMKMHIEGNVLLPPNPQGLGAFGAALFALEERE